MDQHRKDLIVTPTVITVVVSFLFMLWSAWYTGVKFHAPLSLTWLKAVFGVSIPLWFTMPVVIVSIAFAWKGFASLLESGELAKANEYLLGEREKDTQAVVLSAYWKERAQRFEEMIEGLKQPKPVLHASWSGDSVWGWSCSGFVEDPFRTFMVRGTVTLLMDNITEPVVIIGVQIKGLKTMGAFPSFSMRPRETQTVRFETYFQGEGPDGNDYNTLAIVFIDIRGVRYTTQSHQFIPFPIPERVREERTAAALKRLQRQRSV